MNLPVMFLLILLFVSSLYSQEYGCAIMYADNYEPTAIGCEDGTLDCCDFSCSLEYPSTNERIETQDACGDELFLDKLSYPQGYLNDRKMYIKYTPHGSDREVYDIPIVFHDVYGVGYLEEFDIYVPGRNDDGEINRSLCGELTDTETCECLAYKAVKILNEQYSSGNIRFYRACRDDDGRMLSFEDCNSGQGNITPFQELQDYISSDANNLPGHPELDAYEGWSNYIDNAINIYVTECIQYNRLGENCNSSMNGFAQRGSYGTHLHRGLAIRQDVFFSKYSDIDELKNYSTLPHELGHTFNLNHVWKHSGSCGNVDYDPEGEECLMTGDLICDTEAAPCDGFVWQTANLWKDDDGSVYCTFIGQGSVNHNECGSFPNDELRAKMLDVENDDYLNFGTWANIRDVNINVSDSLSVWINPVLPSDQDNWEDYNGYAHDSLGRTYGTREMDLFWDGECEEWFIENHWSAINEGIFHPAPIQNFLANSSISQCRNLGCKSNDPLCTPLEGYTSQQFLAAKFDIEYYLLGCTDPHAENFDPNVVVNDGSCEYATTEISIDFFNNWNLIGIPLVIDDNDYLALFPEAMENTLYSFDETYIPNSVLENGEGYWLRFENPGNTTITGNIINELTISLNEGWNLITGISTILSILDIQDPDGITISGTIYSFNNGVYIITENIEPGKGYWIRVNTAGLITIINN